MVSDAEGRSARPPHPRGGSSVSTSTLVRATDRGHAIECITSDGDSIVTGYLSGLDDYHWRVVDPSGIEWLIHKSGTHVRIVPEQTLDNACEDVLRAVGPFLDWARGSNLLPRNGTKGR